MINMLRKEIKFSMQRAHFQQSYFKFRPHSKRFKCIEKVKSLTFQLRAIWSHTFADDITVVMLIVVIVGPLTILQRRTILRLHTNANPNYNASIYVTTHNQSIN